MNITQKQKEVAKTRIFENLARALLRTNEEDWSIVSIIVKEVIEISKQLEDSEVEN